MRDAWPPEGACCYGRHRVGRGGGSLRLFTHTGQHRRVGVEEQREPLRSDRATDLIGGILSVDGEPALFTSDGSELVFAADGFSHGGVLDPKVGSTAVYVGNPDRMPVFSQGSGHVTNVTHEFGIDEGQETIQILPAGRYWLVTSNGVHVTVRSCPPGGVTLLPTGRKSPSQTGQTPGTSPRAKK